MSLASTAAALLAFGLAAPAAADPAEPYEGSVRAQYTGNEETGETIQMDGRDTGVNLFRLELEDSTVLTTFCIDLETGIRGSAWYNEDEWSNYPGQGDFAEPAKVHWVLQNGYPEVSAAELAEAAGADAHTTDAEALSATQAAIWHFSNGADLTHAPGNTTTIYDHLVGNAEELSQTAEPDATLSITPNEASGQAGETVGEFLIETSASEVPVVLDAPDGVTLVDLETEEVVGDGDSLSNGDTVGFSVPEDAEEGDASFSLSATAMVETGRLFRGEDANTPTQTLITAQGGETTVSASASASWVAGDEEPPESPEPTDEPTEEPAPEPTPTPAPTPTPTPPTPPADNSNQPTLPVTGGALVGLVAAGVAALGAGAGAIYLGRKRKATGAERLEG